MQEKNQAIALAAYKICSPGLVTSHRIPVLVQPRETFRQRFEGLNPSLFHDKAINHIPVELGRVTIRNENLLWCNAVSR